MSEGFYFCGGSFFGGGRRKELQNRPTLDDLRFLFSSGHG